MKKMFSKIMKLAKFETSTDAKNEFYYLEEERMLHKKIELLRLEALRVGPKF